MRYWIDTEFMDIGCDPVELISIGIVAEDGHEYFAISRDCRLDRADEWLRRNVLPQLEPGRDLETADAR